MPRPPTRARWQSQHRSPRGNLRSTITPTTINAQLSEKAEGKRLADSDDSDGLVTKGDGGRRGAYLRPQEVFASGAVGSKDEPNAHPTRAQRRKKLQDAIRSGSKSSVSATPSNSKPTSAANSPKVASMTNAPTAQVQRGPTARPTPVRDDSILNGIKPRKRQNSILRSPGLDDSTLGESTLGSLIVPLDENSPLHLPKHQSVTNTPASESRNSISKKRKLGTDDVPTTLVESARKATSSNPEQLFESLLSEQPSTLRTSAHKHRRKSNSHDDTDIMALPVSSSSELSSPPKPPAKQNKKSKPAPNVITTKELQDRLMPSKRQKRLRAQKKGSTEFEIPSDTDSTAQHESEDSTFIAPGKRRAPRREPKATVSSSKILQPTRRKASDKNQSYPKQNSTAPPPLLVSSRSRPARPTDLERDPAAKSPSQLSSISVASPPQRVPQRRRIPRKTAADTDTAGKAGKQPHLSRQQQRGSKAKKAQGGGSPLKTSFGNDSDNANATDLPDDDKENYLQGAASDVEESAIEVQVGRAAHRELEDDDDDDDDDDDHGISLPSPPPGLQKQQLKGKWAEIDDFEMDFEDVSLPSEEAVSSDPMAR